MKNLQEAIKIGESINIEFKSWIKTNNMRERISLVVDELIAFVNCKGGTVYLGVEDDGEVTGCTGKYDLQSIQEAIYDKTSPHMFTEIEEIKYEEKTVIAISVEKDGKTYTTADGRCLKRLGKNSKPFYSDEMAHVYTIANTNDFSSQIIAESSINDINLMVVYSLKEKLRLRDSASTLPDLEDMAFLKDLKLIVDEGGQIKLTIAGLLFIGKDVSIQRLLPQAEVIYLQYGKGNLEEYNARIDMKQPITTVLDRLTEKIQNDNKIVSVQIGLYRLEVSEYSEKVFQEALLNALSHRDYQQQGAVYVKHYPDKIVIENPGGFLDGITADNIITHPSSPRNKLIAETLQNLRYVQRTGQGVDIIYKEMVTMGKPYPVYRVFNDAVQLTIGNVMEDPDFVKFVVSEQDSKQITFSLAQLMVLRYTAENRKIKLADVQKIAQISDIEAKKCCSDLMNFGLIELVGKEYMLTARVYEAIKSDVEYTRDRVVQYIKAKDMITEYLERNNAINNGTVRELCGFTKQQARTTLSKMIDEDIILKVGNGRATKYELRNRVALEKHSINI
ncbi:MAG: hypothetical protein BHW48_13995 [Roseburia sp. CAG:10041_57]|nr:MAG: hypothetical protein BHW48_13995 [Roseburia sp. CAG:10041_57]